MEMLEHKFLMKTQVVLFFLSRFNPPQIGRARKKKQWENLISNLFAFVFASVKIWIFELSKVLRL